jgi:hypothetical protein
VPSKLDRPIAPEIRDDRLAEAIRRVAARPEVRTILEVGSSSGEGSTDAFVAGALENPAGPPTLHCVELSRERFALLEARHGARDFVHCHRVSSVRLERFATHEDIDRFCSGFKPWLRRRSRKTYRRWLEEDREYVRASGAGTDGVRDIADHYGIDRFDAALIDGSEFTGAALLDDLHGARWLILDDVRAMKNHGNYVRLRRDPAYELVDRSWMLRNGYAVFRRTEG